MAGVIANSLKVVLLRDLLKNSDRPMTLRLYVNNRTPEDGDGLNNYLEADGAGYGSKDLEPGQWTIEARGIARAIYPELAFTFTEELGRVYGYFITRGDDLMWAERFPNGPFEVKRWGDEITLAVSVVLR